MSVTRNDRSFLKYGVRWPKGTPDISIHMFFIANMGNWADVHGVKQGMGLAHHVIEFQKIVWPEDKWHRWNRDLMVPEMCKPGRLAIFGPSSCVHGSTIIDDPMTGKKRTIERLADERIQPWVSTLKGPVLASAPFMRGVDRLWDVEISDGNRFKSTHSHTILTPDGFYPISALKEGSLLYGGKRIASIKEGRKAIYYDLTVPKVHHYSAAGCIHHNSEKSHQFAKWALTMFYSKPNGTTVIVSSTTNQSLERRIWDEVVQLHKRATNKDKGYPDLPGTMLESKHMLLADASDADNRSKKNGVIGVACKSGGTWSGLQEYIGLKNEVVILGADEMQFVPMGVLDSLANLESNVDRCFAVFMGNLPDTNNPLAKAAEPKGGWESLPDTDKSRVYKTRWFNGRAIQLIATDSPNFDYPEGEEPFKHLIGRKYIEQCAYNYGRDTTKFIMFASGAIPRAFMNTCVFTKSQCTKFNAKDDVKWGHQKLTRGYMLDAAYSGVGGDRTVGAPFVFGQDSNGKYVFWCGRLNVFPGTDDYKKSHAEVIAMAVKRDCDAAGIPPEHIFYDGTGRSELTIAFARVISPKVVPLEFGGPATERPVFTGEKWLDGDKAGSQKQCRDCYDRFVTELQFAVGYCIISDQMRGMDEEAIDEGCQRKWEMVKGTKQCIETKDEMKERGLRSCDLIDCIACGVEGARRLGFPLGKNPTVNKSGTNLWVDHVAQESKNRYKSEQLEIA